MMNPILRRDGKIFLRSFKTFIVLGIYSALLLIIAFIANLAITSNSYSFAPESASYIYWAIGAFQIGFLMLIIPAYSGTAISGEREKQTLDILLSTNMSSFSIIIGKLFSSISMGTLLLVTSLPITSIIFYYGGVSIVDFIVLTVYTFLMMVLSASIAILLSSIMKKSSVAIAITNVILIILTVGNLVSLLVVNSMVGSIYNVDIPIAINYIFLSINPIFGYFSIVEKQLGMTIIEDLLNSISYQYYDFDSLAFINKFIVSIPTWVITIIFSIIVILFCIFFALRNLRNFQKK